MDRIGQVKLNPDRLAVALAEAGDISLRGASSNCELIERSIQTYLLGPLRWHHLKRGTTYQEIGRATVMDTRYRLEDHMAVVIFTYANKPGRLFVRSAISFGEDYFCHLVYRATVSLAGTPPKPGDEIIIYRSEEDQRIWVRPTEEFLDGRFEPLDAGPLTL